MENILSCEICCEKYNTVSIIPRVLSCGHSFCSPCIEPLKNSRCPKCRVIIQGRQEIPVNYLILSLIDEYKGSKNSESVAVNHIQEMRSKINATLANIKKEISVKSGQQRSLERDLEILKGLEAELNQKSGSIEVRKKFNEVEKRFEALSLSNLQCIHGTNVEPSFSLAKFGYADSFLQKIYQALKNFEKVFAFKLIDTKLKFGELTFRDNQILIYSLSSDQLPKGSKTIPFDDLKEASKKKTLRTFIEISGQNGTSHVVIINLQDSKQCPHFIKLCTGENGPSYKNCSYSKCQQISKKNNFYDYDRYDNYDNGMLRTILCVDISKSKELPVDYYKNIPVSIQCNRDEIVVTERPNDGFQLGKVNSSYHCSIIGKVVYSSNIWENVNNNNSSTCKILDCGIAIEL